MTEAQPCLVCQRYTARKLKCDKTVPCSHCRAAHNPCHAVQRARKPRGRSGRIQKERASDLEDRVSRIEELLSKAGRKESHSASDGSIRPSAMKGSFENELVAPEFWAALTTEVAGLRETIAGSDDEKEGSGNLYTRNSDEEATVSSLLFNHISPDKSHQPLTADARRTLLDTYRIRVDCLYKIFHWPTFIAQLNHRTGSDLDVLSIQALESAVYFFALCTLTEREVQELGLGQRPRLLQQHRYASEAALAKLNLLTHPTVTSLQALLVYLWGLRTIQRCASSWSLFAVAARAAYAMRLGFEHPGRHSPFDLQIRRRLWFSVGVMDVFAALDRGTMPILSAQGFDTLPLNINDSELLPNSVPEISSSGWTDMSFFRMICEALICHKKMCDIDNFPASYDTWLQKRALVQKLKVSYEERYFSIIDDSVPIQRMCKSAGHKMTTSIQLFLHRPQCPQEHTLVPLSDDFNVMQAAVEVLKSHRAKDDELALWQWKNWVSWHALAVVLAELCGNPRHGLADVAWPIVCESFEEYAQAIADTDSGMLWKPIARLMHKARVLRASNHLVPGATRVRMPSAILAPDFTTNLTSIETSLEGFVPFGNDTFANGTGMDTEYGASENVDSFTFPHSEGQDPSVIFDWNSFLDDINFSE